MLRSQLQDAAIAAAKSRSHGSVEPRHVAYAIARRFREHPEGGRHLEAARRALLPHGDALHPPEMTDAARAVLEAIESTADALRALDELLGDGAAEAPGGGEGTAVREAEAEGDGEAGAVDLAVEEGREGETVAEILKELDQLVGLDTVKERVQSVIAVVQANQTREAAGLPPVSPGLHLVFTGPPGTGKTTVARLMARLYAASGALPGARFTEVARADLVAGYVGQTAIKTAEVIGRTLPGVLFIDEAYALTPQHPSDFGAEAIATIVKAMEDHRHELAVICAGYSEEMSAFLGSNPGLRSRFKTFIDFPDYGPDALVRIFRHMVESTGLRVAPAALAKAERLFERAARRGDFGNARYARSLFEQAYGRMAVRAAEDGSVELSELDELLPEDLEFHEPGVELKGRKVIGFGEGGGGSGEAAP